MPKETKPLLDDDTSHSNYSVVGEDHDEVVDDIECEFSTSTEADVETVILSLSYPRAFGQICRVAIPYSIPQAFNAANVIVTAIVLAELGKDAVAAGPIISTLTYTVLGSPRYFLSGVAIETGQLNGAGDHQAIGRLVQDGYLLSFGLISAAAVIFASAENILIMGGFNHSIARTAQQYFTWSLPAIPPFFLLTLDQQFALGIRNPYVAMVSNITARTINTALGYYLALYTDLGVAGLGVANTAAMWTAFLGQRLYFALNCSMTKRYHLFKPTWANPLPNIIRLIRLGVPLMAQGLSEWGNLMALSLIIGSNNHDLHAEAEQGGLQPYIIATLPILTIAQATGARVANAVGEAKRCIKNLDFNNASIAHNNAIKLGNAGIALSMTLATVETGLMISLSKELADVFLDHDEPDHEEILILSQTILIINAVGLWLDSLRNAAGGALRGYKDVSFMPIISFLTISVIGLSAGSVFSEGLEWGIESLFITRDYGILLAAIALATRWFMVSYNYPRDEEEVEAQAQSSCKRIEGYCEDTCWTPRIFSINHHPTTEDFDETEDTELVAERG